MEGKVIIVEQGSLGNVQGDEYEAIINLLKRRIMKDEGVGVTFVPTLADAQDILKQEEMSSIVFISRGMLSEARQIKDDYPKLRVVIFTGLLPEPGEYLNYISKTDPSKYILMEIFETLKDIVDRIT